MRIKNLIALSLLLALGGCSVSQPIVTPFPTTAPPTQTVELTEVPENTLAPEIVEKYLELFHGCTMCIGSTFEQHCEQYELAYTWYGWDSERVSLEDWSTLFYDTPVTADSVCVAASDVAYITISPKEILRDLNTEIKQAPDYLYIETVIGGYRLTFLLNADGTELADGENIFAQVLDAEPSPASIRGIQASRAGDAGLAPSYLGQTWQLINQVLDDVRETSYATLKARCGSVSPPTETMMEFLYYPADGFLDGETGFQYFREDSYTEDETAVVVAIPAAAVFFGREMDREAIKEYWGHAFCWYNVPSATYSFVLGDVEMYLTSDENGIVRDSDQLVLRISRQGDD